MTIHSNESSCLAACCRKGISTGVLAFGLIIVGCATPATAADIAKQLAPQSQEGGKDKKFEKGSVAVSGKPYVGEKLTAKVSSFTPEPRIYVYQWLRNGEPIEGASMKSYRVTTSDYGKKLNIKVIALKAGYTEATVKSEQVKIGAISARVACNTALKAGKYPQSWWQFKAKDDDTELTNRMAKMFGLPPVLVSYNGVAYGPSWDHDIKELVLKYGKADATCEITENGKDYLIEYSNKLTDYTYIANEYDRRSVKWNVTSRGQIGF